MNNQYGNNQGFGGQQGPNGQGQPNGQYGQPGAHSGSQPAGQPYGQPYGQHPGQPYGPGGYEKKNNTGLIIAIIAAVLLIGGGVLAYFLLSGDDDNDAKDDETTMVDDATDDPTQDTAGDRPSKAQYLADFKSMMAAQGVEDQMALSREEMDAFYECVVDGSYDDLETESLQLLADGDYVSPLAGDDMANVEAAINSCSGR